MHTLDGTSALLNSNKWFPRTGVGVPETSTKYFQSISRRLYRILSHCYFHHTDIFAAVRVQCVCVCVCVSFVCVCMSSLALAVVDMFACICSLVFGVTHIIFACIRSRPSGIYACGLWPSLKRLG